MTLPRGTLAFAAALLFAVPLGAQAAAARPTNDGAIRSASGPCEPCGMDGGTGSELLFGAAVEPDVDVGGIGDESQDPDGGGLGSDGQDDWFDDFAEGDDLDEPAPLIVLMRSARL
jgi:hypothetical protein